MAFPLPDSRRAGDRIITPLTVSIAICSYTLVVLGALGAFVFMEIKGFPTADLLKTFSPLSIGNTLMNVYTLYMLSKQKPQSGRIERNAGETSEKLDRAVIGIADRLTSLEQLLTKRTEPLQGSEVIALESEQPKSVRVTNGAHRRTPDEPQAPPPPPESPPWPDPFVARY